MYMFLEEEYLHPACMSNKSPGMRLQAVLDAAPDLILCILYLKNVINEGLNKLLEFLF